MKMMSAAPFRSFAVATSAMGLLVLLAGCGMGTSAVDTPEMLPGVNLAGNVHGGQNPVSTSTVALFATGPTAVTASPTYTPPNAYGSTPYFLTSTTSDANGNFTFVNAPTYTCPSGDQVYVVATGGNPGLAGTGSPVVYPDNSAIFLVAALGSCSGLASIPTITINEATTVAAAYALSGFAPVGGAGMTEAAIEAATVASPGAGITSTNTNSQGLGDGFGNALNLANIQAGTVYSTTPTGGVVTTNIVNALADILQDCVNSSSSASTACTSLFADATPPTGSGVTAPMNVWQAALNIAQYPGNKVSQLYSLISAQSAFPQSLTTTPNDWTIGVTYSNSTLSGALGVAIDANDNVWLTGSVNANLMEFSPNGTMLSPAMPTSGSTPTGAVGPQGGWTPTYYNNNTAGTGDNWRNLAFDKSGNVWLADGASTNPPASDAYVYKYTPAGTSTLPTQGTITPENFYSVDENVNTYNIAADKYGNIWTATYKKAAGCTGSSGTSSKFCSLVELVPAAYTPYVAFSTFTDTNTASTNGSRGLAVDSTTGNIWTTDIGASKAYLFQTTLNNGSVATATKNATAITLGTAADITFGVALDKSSNAWVVAETSGGLYKISSAGVASAEVTGGGLSAPAYNVIDGNNNIFVANGSSSTSTISAIVEYSPGFNSNAGSFLSPNVGFAPGATYASSLLSNNSIYQPSNLGVDKSGALWTLSTGTGTAPSLSNLVQIFGVAAPTDPVLADGVYGTKP
jgi:hypothetical protein